MNSRIRFLPLQSANGLLGGRKAVRGQGNFLSLKANERQVGQHHENVEKNLEYYHIIVFREWTQGIMVLPEFLNV